MNPVDQKPSTAKAATLKKFTESSVKKTCSQCGLSFEVTKDDLRFYERVSPTFNGKKELIPPPTHCPPCRLKRRLTFRNERTFYERTCDLTGEDIISIYAPDTPYTVYNQKDWWSDKWDPLQYGRDVDFSRPFFEQYGELWKEVPLIALWTIKCENATYNNNCFSLKNCYMCINSDNGQSNLYCLACEFCNDTADSSFTQKSELCYECVDCIQGYQCTFSERLQQCNDCHFSTDLVGCTKCFGCHGLRRKELHMFNKKVSQKEWNERMAELTLTPAVITRMREHSNDIRVRTPQLFAKIIQCENSTGDNLYRCKNAHNCFDVTDAENIKHVVYSPWNTLNSRDLYAGGGVEWVYEYIAGGIGIFNAAFVHNVADGLDYSYYCVYCGKGASNLFGCIGVKKKEYCILNKQYGKEQYKKLVPKIIEHMKKAGEWGEFFPSSLSPFAYNETAAQEEFPLKKKLALQQGYRWRDVNEHDQQPQMCDIPEDIRSTKDIILQELLACVNCGKNYRIISQELAFYRKMEIPIPRVCPDCRHHERLKRRNPRKLWKRPCGKCGKEVESTYAPDREETVYCESCYLKEVY